MEIVAIYPPYLYTIRLGGESNEYKNIVERLTDIDYIQHFFEQFEGRVSSFWIKILGNVGEEIEEYITEVNNTVLDIRDDLKKICSELKEGKITDFNNYFEPHSKKDFRKLPDGGGKSNKYGIKYLPVKCFGSNKPSLVRLYAIELSLSCYIIVYGGIKVEYDTNDCPALDAEGNEITLEEGIENAVHTVCNYLNENHIFDRDSLIEYLRR